MGFKGLGFLGLGFPPGAGVRFLRTVIFAADMLWGQGSHACPGPGTPLAMLCVDSGAFLLAVHTFSCQVRSPPDSPPQRQGRGASACLPLTWSWPACWAQPACSAPSS